MKCLSKLVYYEIQCNNEKEWGTSMYSNIESTLDISVERQKMYDSNYVFSTTVTKPRILNHVYM